MNQLLNEYRRYLTGKTCAVLGIGISNLPLIGFLLDAGAKVVARDKKDKDMLGDFVPALEERGVIFRCGEGYLDDLYEDILYKTPGLRFDHPAIAEAAARGAIVTSEMEAFLSLCPATILAVTGSDGKTTTTTLTAKLLEASGHRVFLGGNIGKPLLAEIDDITEDDFAVLELSSFQLHTIGKFRNEGLPGASFRFPDAAIVTNISPNHLDWHTSYDEYIDAKRAIFRFMRQGGRLVTNAGNDITAGFASEAKAAGLTVETFSAHTDDGDLSLDGNTLTLRGTPILSRQDILLPGIHNVENYMAAILATRPYVTSDAVRHVASTFGGVEHRLEFVRSLDGVSYYNSSIDSSPSRTVAAVTSFPPEDRGHLVLMMGGYDKHIPYAPVGAPVCDAARVVVLCGATAEKIADAIRSAENYREGHPVLLFEPDFKKAVECAKASALPGDKVILTPASASFDLFRNFEERGRLFKSIVKGW